MSYGFKEWENWILLALRISSVSLRHCGMFSLRRVCGSLCGSCGRMEATYYYCSNSALYCMGLQLYCFHLFHFMRPILRNSSPRNMSDNSVIIYSVMSLQTHMAFFYLWKTGYILKNLCNYYECALVSSFKKDWLIQFIQTVWIIGSQIGLIQFSSSTPDSMILSRYLEGNIVSEQWQ